MKAERSFAGRSAANHCAQLLRAGPGPEALLPALERLGTRLARLLGPALAGLGAGETAAASAGPPRLASAADCAAGIGPLAANSLLAGGPGGAPLLVSVPAAAVLALVDRAFGGRGEAPVPLPADFPVSADMMIQRLEVLMVRLLNEAMGDGQAVHALWRDPRLAELAPFPADATLAVIELALAEAGRAPWALTLAMPLPTLAALPGSGTRAARPDARAAAPAGPAQAPFADLPLPVAAVLVDMRLSLASVAALPPGTVLPVAVERAAALTVGGHRLARGTVGSQDGNTAIRLTRIG